MFRLIWLLSNPIGVMMLGFLAVAAGAIMIADGSGKVPGRGELIRVAGTVTRVTKTWKKHKSPPSGESVTNVRYEFEVLDPGGQLTILDIPGEKLSPIQNTAYLGGLVATEARAKALIGEPIAALVLGYDISGHRASDPWELSAATITMIDYETSRKQRIRHLAQGVTYGRFFASAGGIVILLGAIWWRVRRYEGT
jgi:hypothetical protein